MAPAQSVPFTRRHGLHASVVEPGYTTPSKGVAHGHAGSSPAGCTNTHVPFACSHTVSARVDKGPRPNAGAWAKYFTSGPGQQRQQPVHLPDERLAIEDPPVVHLAHPPELSHHLPHTIAPRGRNRGRSGGRGYCRGRGRSRGRSHPSGINSLTQRLKRRTLTMPHNDAVLIIPRNLSHSTHTTRILRRLHLAHNRHRPHTISSQRRRTELHSTNRRQRNHLLIPALRHHAKHATTSDRKRLTIEHCLTVNSISSHAGHTTRARPRAQGVTRDWPQGRAEA